MIGINSLIRGLRTGIGFAIPSNLAKEISEKLIADGKVTRAWLGVGIRSLGDYAEFKDTIKGVEDGVVVYTIQPDGPASKSDLKPSDIITAVDGRRVSTAQDLKNEVRGKLKDLIHDDRTHSARHQSRRSAAGAVNPQP